MAHTPTPWRFEQAKHPDNTGGFDCAIIDGRNKIIAETFQNVGYVGEEGSLTKNYDSRDCKANAEFIVRACNSHDDLVAALGKLLESYGTFPYAWSDKEIDEDENVIFALSALAKAEAVQS